MVESGLIFGGLLILVCFILVVVFNPFIYKRFYKRLRTIEAVENLKRASGLSVEEGKRLHLCLGNANMLSTNNAAGYVGLNVLDRLTRVSISSDNPPITTCGDSTLALLSQETLKTAYRSGNALDVYSSQQARLAGTSAFSYAVGVLPSMTDEKVSSHILVGHFGPEVALLTDAGERQGAQMVTASDTLEGQAVIYAASSNPLIGEELYALTGYIQVNPFHQACLRVQDIMRWVLIGGLLLGVLIRIMMLLLWNGVS